MDSNKCAGGVHKGFRTVAMPKCRKYRCCHVISDSYGSYLSQISLWPRDFGQLQTVVMLSDSGHDFRQGHSGIRHAAAQNAAMDWEPK